MTDLELDRGPLTVAQTVAAARVLDEQRRHGATEEDRARAALLAVELADTLRRPIVAGA